MRMTGAGPSCFVWARRVFHAGKRALLSGLNGLAERLAVWIFYPLAAHPAGRTLSAQNLAANRTQDICGPLVLRQEAAPVCGLRFGKSSAGHAGCGPVSVYNALVLLGRAGAKPISGGAAAQGAGPAGQGAAAEAPAVTLAGVIRTFEKSRAMILNGRAGASPWALKRVLRRYGIAARRVYSLAALEKALQPGGIAILMIWNDRAHITRGAHFFTVQRAENGQSYAAYNRSPERSPTLAGLVGKGRFAAGVLLQPPEAHR